MKLKLQWIKNREKPWDAGRSSVQSFGLWETVFQVHSMLDVKLEMYVYLST